MKTPTLVSASREGKSRDLAGGLCLLFMTLFVPLLAATIPEGDPIVGTDGNILVNANFQAKDSDLHPLRWERQIPEDMTLATRPGLFDAIVTQEEKHGPEAEDASVKIMDDSGTEGFYLRSEKRLATGGDTYRVHGWVKTSSATPPILVVEFWDVNNKRVPFPDGATYKIATPTASTDWQKVDIGAVRAPVITTDSNVPPDDAPDIVLHVTVSIFTAAASTGTSYWDDIFLEPIVQYKGAVTPGVRELFMDNYRLESTFDVERVVHPPTTRQRLFTRNASGHPWERNTLQMTGAVMKDTPPSQPGYRMWYYGGLTEEYATSPDGLSWSFPTTTTYTYTPPGGGTPSTNTNVAFPFDVGRITLVYDPQGTPQERYKAMLNDPKFNNPATGTKIGYYYYYSADGINWNPGNGGYQIFPAGDQGAIGIEISGTNRRFIATTKQRTLLANTMANFAYDRIAFVAVSNDFINWKQPGSEDLPGGIGSQYAVAVESDQADDFAAQARRSYEKQTYGMPIHPYESVYIGLAWTFEVTDYDTGVGWRVGNGPLHPQLAVSRDLVLWERPSRDSIIPPTEAGSWEDGVIYSATGNIFVDGNNMHLYYSGATLGHTTTILSADEVASRQGDEPGSRGGDPDVPEGKDIISYIARATWRRDGFVSMHNAGDEPGTIVTKSMTVTGATRLKVNAVVSGTGSLRVEILKSDNTPYSGFPAANATEHTGDLNGGTITWTSGTTTTSNIAALSGKSIKLKFYLKGGDLYSYWFE